MKILKRLFCKHKYEEWGIERQTFWDKGQKKPIKPQLTYRVFKCDICGKEKRYEKEIVI